MMSKKQWFVLLCLFVVYVLLGALLFYHIEKYQEDEDIKRRIEEKIKIQELLKANFNGSKKSKATLFRKLSDYCGKPLDIDMSQHAEERKWDFYNAVFFVITVVSTIGYGNLSPTTSFSRIFMIFYALIGISINGILMVTLGEFFGKSFKKLYQRWKNSKLEYDTARMGLIGQIILYLIPGFTFFIFLPATIMTVFEGWTYEVAVYYCFVTLTTIGFGDFVAGTNDVADYGELYQVYKIFLLVWIIGGLGYILMVINFITRGLQSKRMIQLEHKISENIKNTPKKIRQELRGILQEFLFLRVKPVYKGEFEYVPHQLERSQSCPDLTMYRIGSQPPRKRAMSECYRYAAIQRIQSDTDLEKIDKEKTFRPTEAIMQQKDLLLKVVDALSYDTMEPKSLDSGGYHGFSDKEILQSEITKGRQRRRAVSDIRPPCLKPNPKIENTWYGADAAKAFEELRKNRTNRALSMSETPKSDKTTLLQRIRNKLLPKENKIADIEKQAPDFADPVPRRPSFFLTQTADDQNQNTASGRDYQEQLLEQTSIADFIRALSAITVPEIIDNEASAQKESPPRTRRTAIRANYQGRRSSLMSPVHASFRERRLSLRPVENTQMPSLDRLISVRPPTIQEANSRRTSVRPDTTFLVPPPTYSGGRRFSLKHSEPEQTSSSITDTITPPPYSRFPVETNTSLRISPHRTFTVRPTNMASMSFTNSPVLRQVTRRERTDTGDSDK